ncbi:MAG TPA: histidine kinase [Steroidobacteraceae bacterium]|nr:histidine kinase [Steroidobacteraceae bacterium]
MYSLREPLPADVVAHAAGPFGGYRRYPVFSAPWLLGRCAIFMPITGSLGVFEAALIGYALNDSRLGWQTAAACVPIWLAFGTAGPVLATIARHRLPPTRLTVPLAILLGLVVSFTGQHLAEIYSRTVIAPRYMAVFPGFDPTTRHSSALLVWAVWGWQFALFSFLGGGVALIAFFREQHWWQVSRHEQQLAAANREKGEADLRLMVLQAQVEPHFLFNTLASVHSLIRQDPARAEATLEALVDHLRVTLPKLRTDVGNTHSTLAEQLEICCSYLTVMKVRMGPRFTFVIDVDPALQAHPFPPLLLISLVENAIKHGIERTTGNGQIMVNAAIESLTQARQLVVSVVDTGAGLRASAAVGMGLNNIRDQLIARFGPRGSLTLQDRTAGGVIATVRVPYEAAA